MSFRRGKWLWIILFIAITVLAMYFLSGFIKWIPPLLLIFAYAGAENLPSIIRAIFLLIIISAIAYIFMWFTQSPEYKAGMSAYDNAEYSAAAEHFTKVLTQDPDNFEVLLARCKALRKTGHPEQALADCSRTIQLDTYSNKTDAYAARARVYRDMGMEVKALRNFSLALQNYSWDCMESKWYLLYERGILDINLGKNNAAIQDLKNAFELNKEWYPVWLPLGNAYYNIGNNDMALSAYEKYLNGYDPKEDALPETIKERIFLLRKSNSGRKSEK